jgi:hypothetical protein
MRQDATFLFLYQMLVAVLRLTFVSVGLATARALLSLRQLGGGKRPGLNLREL